MPANRTPIGRSPKPQITPAAIAAFRKLRDADMRCTCPPIDWGGEYWKRPPPCDACETWWEQHHIIFEELQCRVWEWPCVEDPEAVCCYPEGSPAALAWKPRPEAQERWRLLAAAADAEARR